MNVYNTYVCYWEHFGQSTSRALILMPPEQGSLNYHSKKSKRGAIFPHGSHPHQVPPQPSEGKSL
ncbi:hypothetical protein HanPSC8_Chr17g0796781 [Helianthus annuus]|nr:hypothetical protein HanPSC8_Chr17g0796781 [Helianthus annuus]